MKKTITLNSFRRIEAAEEAMMRTLMPRTAAASPEPLVSEIRNQPRRTWRAGSLVSKGAFTMAEVAR